MNRDVIIACDFANKKECLEFLDKFGSVKPFLKIGMELFYKEGTEFVKYLKECGYKIFLDLKLCDIPNTVSKAMSNLKELNVDIINLHAFGGKKMMESAVQVFKGTNTKVIAVTILTSLDNEVLKNELFIDGDVNKIVNKYAKNALEVGLDGVVCSPLEVELVKKTCGDNFITVTPGIRFDDDNKNDQKRVTTPLVACQYGTNYIVVGRSITESNDPVLAYKRCVKEFVE